MITAVLAAAGLASAAVSLATPPASTGTGIQGGNVCLAASAKPGTTYSLEVGITDAGSSAATLSVVTAPLWPGQRLYRGERPIGPSWVSFSPAMVALNAGQGATVAVTLTVPAGARPGLYVANILAGPKYSPVWSGNSEMAHLAGFAQTFLIFSVSGPASSCALPPPSGSPWSSQYAPLQPQEQTVSRAWLEKHLPWVFGKRTTQPVAVGTPAPAADTASVRIPDKAPDGPAIAASAAVLALILSGAWLGRRSRRSR